MGHRFAELAFTPQARAAQEAAGSCAHYARRDDGPAFNATLGDEERAFLQARDSVYLASVGETGWPYVQHRGGSPGFVHVLDARTIAFADFRGNRQYVTVGNLAGESRIALIAVDYARRRRLKLLGHARVVTPESGCAVARAAEAVGVSRGDRARTRDHGCGVRLELPAAHHAAVHGGGDRGGDAAAARAHRGARSGESAAARGRARRSRRCSLIISCFYWIIRLT
jgi:hypothetical protein